MFIWQAFLPIIWLTIDCARRFSFNNLTSAWSLTLRWSLTLYVFYPELLLLLQANSPSVFFRTTGPARFCHLFNPKAFFVDNLSHPRLCKVLFPWLFDISLAADFLGWSLTLYVLYPKLLLLVQANSPSGFFWTTGPARFCHMFIPQAFLCVDNLAHPWLCKVLFPQLFDTSLVDFSLKSQAVVPTQFQLTPPVVFFWTTGPARFCHMFIGQAFLWIIWLTLDCARRFSLDYLTSAWPLTFYVDPWLCMYYIPSCCY